MTRIRATARRPHGRRLITLAAAAGAAVLTLAACSSSGSGSPKSDSTGAGSPSSGSVSSAATGGSLTTVKIQTAPGNVLPYIGYLAQYLGYFKQNGIKPQFTQLTTGVAAGAALQAGSINVIFADPASTGPQLAQGQKLTLILGEQLNQWQLIVNKSLAGKSLPDALKAMKNVGAPSAHGGSSYLLVLLEKAYGMKAGSITTVSDQSGAGVLSGAEQGILAEPTFSCVLETKGLAAAFSFGKPADPVSSYPASVQPMIAIPDVAYWTSSSWASSHQSTVTGLQKALTEAENWANNPANLDQWLTIMRASNLNQTSLNDAQYKDCLSSAQGTFSPKFSAADASNWNDFVKTTGLLPNGIPDSSQWLDPSVPSS